MRICDENEFARSYQRVYGERVPVDAQGFVDRRNGMMILKEFPARNFGKTKVGLALHEAVHLFSHPAGKSNQTRGTAFSLLNSGLIEGITQMITDDILAEQEFSPLPERWQAYGLLTPIAREFVRSFSPLVAEAYFNGAILPLFNAIQARWTMPAFQRVAELANQKQKNPALQLMTVLNQPRVTQFQQVFR
jgi:hypothetical protein